MLAGESLLNGAATAAGDRRALKGVLSGLLELLPRLLHFRQFVLLLLLFCLLDRAYFRLGGLYLGLYLGDLLLGQVRLHHLLEALLNIVAELLQQKLSFLLDLLLNIVQLLLL